MQDRLIQDGLLVPPQIWVHIFILVCSAMFVGALYHAVKVGIYEYDQSKLRGDPRLAQLISASLQVFFLCGFVFMYWLLESGAHSFTPYFVYAPAFPDGVDLWKIASPKFDTACPSYVYETLMRLGPEYNRIPLSVLMMEASLTYASMWTALILHTRGRARYVLVPLWAALFVVCVDALLDPVVAAKYTCQGEFIAGLGSGIGFWHWFLPSGQDAYLAGWFGVPLFNYAAWWTAPVILISLAMALMYIRGRLWRSYRHRIFRSASPLQILESAPESPLFALTFVVLLAGWVLVQIAPAGQTPPIWLQWILLSLAILATAVFVGWKIRSFETDSDADPNLTLPPLVFLALPVLALLIEGFFLNVTGLIVVGLISAVLVIGFTMWPYQEAVLRVCWRVIDLDRFIRLAYFGYSSTLVLLGAFSVALEQKADKLEFHISGWQIGGLLVVALALHAFAYLSNDVIDLDIDVGQPKRQGHPLVLWVTSRGTKGISPQTAWALALVQIPIALMAARLLEARPLAYAVLIGAFVLMSIYNVYGKWCEQPRGWRRRLIPSPQVHAPLLTDLIQALAWGALVVFGALVIDPGRVSDNWILVWTVFSFAAGFILIINGIHGGLRDLENDTANGAWTTARWLGARVEEGGGVLSNWKIIAFAYTVQTAMFVVMPSWLLLTARAPGDPPMPGTIELEAVQRIAVAVVIGLAFVLSQIALVGVVRCRETRRDRHISVHPLVLMHAPWIAFLPITLHWTAFCILIVVFYAPLLSNERVLHTMLRVTHPGIADRLRRPS